MIRCVTKNWEVIELLVRCSLFKNKLNSETLANHILDTIVNRVGLELKNWLCTQQDRAQTNKSCLRLISKSCSDAQPTKNYCCSHGLSNCGKRVTGTKRSAQFAEKFRQQWQKVILHPGKAQQKAKSIFKEAPLTAGGVRIFVKFEQIHQISKVGVDTIMEQIIPWCISNKVSEDSSRNLNKMFNDPDNDAESELAMAMVEMVAISDKLLLFCESCYVLEGDAELILRAKSVFDRIDAKISDSGSVDNKYEDVLRRAMILMQKVVDRYHKKLTVQKRELVMQNGMLIVC